MSNEPRVVKVRVFVGGRVVEFDLPVHFRRRARAWEAASWGGQVDAGEDVQPGAGALVRLPGGGAGRVGRHALGLPLDANPYRDPGGLAEGTGTRGGSEAGGLPSGMSSGLTTGPSARASGDDHGSAGARPVRPGGQLPGRPGGDVIERADRELTALRQAGAVYRADTLFEAGADLSDALVGVEQGLLAEDVARTEALKGVPVSGAPAAVRGGGGGRRC